MAKRSQVRRLFDILIDGMWHINGELARQISSSKFGFCMRLTGRVHDLRQLGFDIRCEPIDTRRGVFKYRMFTPRDRIDYRNMKVMHIFNEQEGDPLNVLNTPKGQTNLFKELEG